MKQNSWKYYHFIPVYHIQKSYDVWFLRYGVWQTEFFYHFGFFLTFYSSNDLKNENFYKMKKLFGDIIQIQNISPNMMIMCYIAPEIWCVTDVVFIFHSNLFFVLLPPRERYHHFTHVDQKLWWHDVLFPRYGMQQRRIDRQTDGQKKWHIEVGALPKN